MSFKERAIPTKILMPDGSCIEEYVLINPLNKLKIFSSKKSVFLKRQSPFETSHRNYDKHFYDKNSIKC